MASTNPTDGGSPLDPEFSIKGPEIGVSDLAISSGHPQLLFAGTWHTGVLPGAPMLQSIVLVVVFTVLRTRARLGLDSAEAGLPDGDWGRVGVDIAPDGKRVYALIQVKKSGLYRSDDGGDTWTLANDDARLTSRAWYFNGITIDPKQSRCALRPECRSLPLGGWRQDHFDRPGRARRR